MENNKKSSYPQWVLKHKKPGTEIRVINGHYYLYAITSQWDSNKKRAVKKTIGIRGKITKDGFTESDKHRLREGKPVIKKIWQREYGFTHFLQCCLQDSITHLQRYFPDDWQTIVAMSFCRFVYQSPLKNMDFRFRHSYLSELYPEVDLDRDHLTIFIRYLGEQREAIRNYFNAFWNNNKHSVLFDVSSITSMSKQMEVFPQVGYNNQKNFDPQLNIMFIHSVEQRMLLYYRVLPGNIRDVKAFSLSLKEFDKKEVTVITDKGFYSNKNLKEMKDEGIIYIVPLRRNALMIDYTKLQEGKGYKNLDGYFEFEKRIIWYYTLQTDWGKLYVYSDDFLRAEEQRDYLMRIEKYPDNYSMEGYHQKQPQFGTIALLTNGKASAAADTYENYKSRNEIEILFDAYKNVLHADRTYMQNNIAIEAWMFINFIAIQWYYITFNLLKKYKLNKIYSPLDLMMKLTEIRKIKINNEWFLSENTKATDNLLARLKIPIP